MCIWSLTLKHFRMAIIWVLSVQSLLGFSESLKRVLSNNEKSWAKKKFFCRPFFCKKPWTISGRNCRNQAIFHFLSWTCHLIEFFMGFQMVKELLQLDKQNKSYCRFETLKVYVSIVYFILVYLSYLCVRVWFSPLQVMELDNYLYTTNELLHSLWYVRILGVVCYNFFSYVHFVCIYIYSVVDCGDLTDPRNGDVSLTTTTFNSRATYTCSSGFVLVGQNTRVCRASGEWSGEAPLCKRSEYWNAISLILVDAVYFHQICALICGTLRMVLSSLAVKEGVLELLSGIYVTLASFWPVLSPDIVRETSPGQGPLLLVWVSNVTSVYLVTVPSVC